MKKLGIFALASIMVMGLAISAQATLIINNSAEPTLWSIIDGWTGLSLNQNDLQNATALGTLSAGSYAIVDYAKYAGFSQTIDVPSGNLLNLTSGNVNTPSNIPFSEVASFGFSDTSSGGGTRTTVNQNPPNQSYGFIFNLGQFNPAFAGQYVVAFEDGAGCRYGDSDYNDLVAHVSTVPVPPSALLLGSGLLGIIGVRRLRKS